MSARRVASLLSVAIILPITSGCGDTKFTQADVDRARQEGRQQERQKVNEKKTAQLQAELDAIKKGGKTGSSTKTKTVTVPTAATPQAAPAPSSGECGSGLSVNGATSCAFAREVRNAYTGTGSYDIFSPTTGKTYSMFCSGTNPTTCTGGNNARVSFP